MASKIGSSPLRASRLAARSLPLTSPSSSASSSRAYAQVLSGSSFNSRDLIPDEPAGPSVRTESVPGPAGKAAVCAMIPILQNCRKREDQVQVAGSGDERAMS